MITSCIFALTFFQLSMETNSTHLTCSVLRRDHKQPYDSKFVLQLADEWQDLCKKVHKTTEHGLAVQSRLLLTQGQLMSSGRRKRIRDVFFKGVNAH